MIKCRILSSTSPEATRDPGVNETFRNFRLAQWDSQRQIFSPILFLIYFPLLSSQSCPCFVVLNVSSFRSLDVLLGNLVSAWHHRARWLNGHAINQPALSLRQWELTARPSSPLIESLRIGAGCREALLMSYSAFERPGYCTYCGLKCFKHFHNTTKHFIYFGSNTKRRI